MKVKKYILKKNAYNNNNPLKCKKDIKYLTKAASICDSASKTNSTKFVI